MREAHEILARAAGSLRALSDERSPYAGEERDRAAAAALEQLAGQAAAARGVFGDVALLRRYMTAAVEGARAAGAEATPRGVVNDAMRRVLDETRAERAAAAGEG